MCRFSVSCLAILLGLFGWTDLAFAQVQPAQPRPTTFAEASASLNALRNLHGNYRFSASGTENGLPWSIDAMGISSGGGGGGSTVQLPYYYFLTVYYYPPVYHYPTVEPATTVESSRGSRLEWLDREQPRPTATRPVPRFQRHVSEAERTRAEQSLAQGDASFARQKYSAAVERYSSAARLAPDWADPHFRRGFALVATGNYSRAVAAFRAGLKLRSDWSESVFRLDAIYAAGALEETNQQIAQRLGRDPLDHDLLFANGMQLFFAGEHQRSTIYLSQAASLEADEAGLLEAFLEPLVGATAK
ncbi:MAG: tetratricopeptide repeat protein [Pirellulales bacterium]